MDPRSPEFQRTPELQYQVGGVRRSESLQDSARQVEPEPEQTGARIEVR